MTQYVIEHEGKQFSPDGLMRSPVDVETHNAAIEAQELAYWDTKPERWQVYVTGTKVATWLGATLGEIYRSNVYRNNLGAKITSIRVRGTNGASYYGRYGSDWSQLCLLRKMR